MEKSLNAPRQGDVLTGRVLLITRDYVIVDINYKCEGQRCLPSSSTPTATSG